MTPGRSTANEKSELLIHQIALVEKGRLLNTYWVYQQVEPEYGGSRGLLLADQSA